MDGSANTLPDDVDALKALLRQREQEIENLNNSVEQFKARAASLQEQLNILIAKRFGPSSEKVDNRQLGLFNEVETAVDEEESASGLETLTVPAHARKKPGRKPLPDYIEREEVLHDEGLPPRRHAAGAHR